LEPKELRTLSLRSEFHQTPSLRSEFHPTAKEAEGSSTEAIPLAAAAAPPPEIPAADEKVEDAVWDAAGGFWEDLRTGRRWEGEPPPDADEVLPIAATEERLVLSEAEAAGFASVGEAYSHAARLALRETRDSSSAIELRRASNFVKDGPIRVCVSFWAAVLRGRGLNDAPPRISVLDLCCGRGQDLDKFRRAARDADAHLAMLIGADVAGKEAAAAARDRWSQSAAAALADSRRTTALLGGTLLADLAGQHAAAAIYDAAEAARWDEDSLPFPSSFHIATCFFALHYFFRSEEALCNLVAGASYLLRDGGFLAVIHSDGESIAAAYRSCRTPTFRVGQATLRLHPATAAMLDGEGDAGRAPSPFGWAYDFTLPNHVDNVTEYLVHSPTRDRIMERFHMVKIYDEAADATLQTMIDVPFWKDAFAKCAVAAHPSGQISAETADHLALYRVAIYTKSPLRADIDAARAFIREKLGFKE